MNTYKILSGVHRLGGKTYACRKAIESKSQNNFVGDVIETKIDLVERYPGKFILLSDAEKLETEVDQKDDEPDFQNMTTADLKKFAKENDIPLVGLTDKESILKAVLEAWGE